LPAGEHILLSLACGRVSIHLLYLRGLVPGRAIHKADAASVARAVSILSRDLERFPELPNDAAMQALLVGATAALTDPGISAGAVGRQSAADAPVDPHSRGARAGGQRGAGAVADTGGKHRLTIH
jgi:hypothetical protein